MPIVLYVNRANYLIAGFGLVACVVLSLAMKHTLKIQEERVVAPVVADLMRLYGSKFSEPASFRVRTADEGGRYGELKIHPLFASSQTRLVSVVGEFAWRNLGPGDGIEALTIITDDGLGRKLRYFVPHPKKLGQRVRRIEPDEDPVALAARVARRPKRSGVAASKPTSQQATASKPTTASAPSAARSQPATTAVEPPK